MAVSRFNSLVGYARERTLLLGAISIRVVASAIYLVLLWAVARIDGPAAAADFVCVISFCYVSSMLGRFGTDQAIPRRAFHFRNVANSRASSILLTHLVTGLVSVPFAALIIQWISVALLGQTGTHLSTIEVAIIAMLFAVAQTFSVAAQSAGFSVRSAVVFPLASWLLLLAAIAFGLELSASTYLVCFGLPALFGLVVMWKGLRWYGVRPRARWLWEGRHYYIMAINFYSMAWVPNLFLHALVSPTDLVFINAAVRVAATQQLPASAAIAYFQPILAIKSIERRFNEIELILSRVIILNFAAQIFLILGGTFLLWAIKPPFDVRSAWIIGPFLVSNLIAGLLGPSGPTLSMMNAQAAMAKISTITTGAGLFASLLAAIYYGSIGYALVASTANIIQSGIYALMLWRRWGIFGMARVAQPNRIVK